MKPQADKKEALAYELRIQGVPEDVVDYIISLNTRSFFSTVNDFLQLSIMIIGFGAGAFIWIAGSQYSETKAIEKATALGGVLYEDIFGISMLFALFGWIFATTFITTRPYFFSERYIASVFAESLSLKNKKRLPWRRAYDNIDKTVSPREQLAAVFKTTGDWTKWPTVILTFCCVFTFEREMDWHTIYTGEYMIARSNWGVGDWVERPWSRTASVEVGCNHVTGRNSSDDPVYKINFQDGGSVRLGNAKGFNQSWLDGMEIIDKALVANNVEFKRWSWRQRNPLHPKCLSKNKAELSSEEYARLLKLLRVGVF